MTLNQMTELLNHSVTSSATQASLEAAGDSGLYALGIVNEEFLIWGFTTFPWGASLLMAVENFAGEPDLNLNLGFDYWTWVFFFFFPIWKIGIMMPHWVAEDWWDNAYKQSDHHLTNVSFSSIKNTYVLDPQSTKPPPHLPLSFLVLLPQ